MRVLQTLLCSLCELLQGSYVYTASAAITITALMITAYCAHIDTITDGLMCYSYIIHSLHTGDASNQAQWERLVLTVRRASPALYDLCILTVIVIVIAMSQQQ
jgi:TRAP-type C4-dicarboxylate transport system permease large subunit